MNSLEENISDVRRRMAEAARRAGRDPEDVTLVAVSKTVPLALALEAARAGVTDFGENYVQEYDTKKELTKIGCRLHFIGQLQRNKVKYIISDVACIHSLDRLPLALEIQRRAAAVSRCVDVLIQIGFGSGENRGGVAPGDAAALVREIEKLPNVALRGLMTVPPAESTPEEARRCFRTLRALRDDFQKEGRDMPELSMGMSADFEVAVEEGATLVRVGTTVFGARNYEGRIQNQ